MFVRQAAACSAPNSETPMSAGRIDRQASRVSSVGAAFTSGNEALFGLVNRLGGNSPGVMRGDSGIPTTGVPLSPTWLPTRGRGGAGGAGSGLWNGTDFAGGGDRSLSFDCVPPAVVPVVTVLSVPIVATPAASVPAPRATPQPAAVPAPSVPAVRCADPPECTPTPENICRNIRDGCYLDSQTSQRQKFACSWAGWAGNTNYFQRCPGGWNGGVFIPDLNLNPVNTEGDPMPGNPAGGLAGIPGGDPLVPEVLRGVATLAAFAGGAYLFHHIFSKGRR